MAVNILRLNGREQKILGSNLSNLIDLGSVMRLLGPLEIKMEMKSSAWDHQEVGDSARAGVTELC